MRIEPLSPPYDDKVAEELTKVMPPGVEPIRLFRTLAKNPRVLQRVRRGGLLDPGTITLRQRELIILRTTALSRAEYEWGVHVAFFGDAAGIDADQSYATVWLGPEAACWSADDSVLVRACDELHASSQLSDAVWADLRARLREDQIVEVLVLAGTYRAISYVVNVAGVALEDGAARFPPR
jgi:4-carboxymuconolactone decarboxylase